MHCLWRFRPISPGLGMVRYRSHHGERLWFLPRKGEDRRRLCRISLVLEYCPALSLFIRAKSLDKPRNRWHSSRDGFCTHPLYLPHTYAIVSGYYDDNLHILGRFASHFEYLIQRNVDAHARVGFVDLPRLLPHLIRCASHTGSSQR